MSWHVISCHVAADESSQKWPTHTIVARSMRYDAIRYGDTTAVTLCTGVTKYTALHCSALYTVLYCTVLYCYGMLYAIVCHSDTAIIIASTSTSLEIS
jgi:hypothetical protein